MFERHGSLSGQRLSPPPEDDLRERFIPPGGNAHSMGVVNRRLSRTVSHCPHLSQPRPDASSLPSVGGGGRKGPVGRYGIRISGMAFPTAFVIRWMACCTRRVLRTPAGYGRPCRKSVCGPSVNGPRRDRRSRLGPCSSRAVCPAEFRLRKDRLRKDIVVGKSGSFGSDRTVVAEKASPFPCRHGKGDARYEIGRIIPSPTESISGCRHTRNGRPSR